MTIWKGAAAVAVVLVATGTLAAAQMTPNYRAVAPRALVSIWTQAPNHERPAIAEALAARPAEARVVLRDAARTGTTPEKVFALGMLAELRDRDGVDVVVAASRDADVRVRRRAATALRILNDRRAAQRLRALTRSESDLGVLKSALAALGRLGLQRDVKTIAPFLEHEDVGVRVVAAGALAMLGDERGLDVVLHATDVANPGVQKSATYALGFFTDPVATARLDAILADPDGAWKAYALLARAERALAGQPASRQVELLDEFSQMRSRTVAEWAVDRLTDLEGPEAEAVLRRVSNRPTPVGAIASRRLLARGVQR